MIDRGHPIPVAYVTAGHYAAADGAWTFIRHDRHEQRCEANPHPMRGGGRCPGGQVHTAARWVATGPGGVTIAAPTLADAIAAAASSAP